MASKKGDGSGVKVASIWFGSAGDFAAVRKAAKLTGIPYSTLIRDAAVARSHEIIKEHEKAAGACPACGSRPKRKAA